MQTMKAGFTFQQILPLILALLLIFIIPMLMRRYGLEPEDLIRILFSGIRKKDYDDVRRKAGGNKANRREPHLSNGRSSDLKGLVSTLLIFVRRNGLGLVYPGTVEHRGQVANLLALMVTKSEVIGFNCFGFGGTVTEDKSKGVWTQHMNGADQKIPDPLAGNRAQYALVRSAMDAHGMQDVPLRVVAVFTAGSVTLQTKHPREVFSVQGLLEHLKESVSAEEESFEPSDMARRLNECVKRIKPGKQR